MNNKLIAHSSVTQNSLKEPKYFNEIYYLPDKQNWLDAVNEELSNMKRLKVFSPVKVFRKEQILCLRNVFSNTKETHKGQ